MWTDGKFGQIHVIDNKESKRNTKTEKYAKWDQGYL